jgi:hypothetical protein
MQQLNYRLLGGSSPVAIRTSNGEAARQPSPPSGFVVRVQRADWRLPEMSNESVILGETLIAPGS